VTLAKSDDFRAILNDSGHVTYESKDIVKPVKVNSTVVVVSQYYQHRCKLCLGNINYDEVLVQDIKPPRT